MLATTEKVVGAQGLALLPRGLFRDYQEINYPILWGGHLVRPKPWAGETPTPQEKLYVFLFGSPLPENWCNRVSTVNG
ncbi:hypothetical protein A6S26_18650 [Nostoc sp. ATCC 43529]|nr:hypothetical protein A6S26_18650 [Nostoc sp. ATCC 43529]